MLSNSRLFLIGTLSLVSLGLLQDLSYAQVQARPFFGRGLPGGGYGQNYGLGYYGLGGPFEMPYAMGRIPTPPYFALHPPVYYSHAVPRTYGYSPFAYPGTYETPEVIKTQPLDVKNPYAEPKQEAVDAESTHHVAATPVVIRNPFTDRENTETNAEVANSTN